MAQGMILGAILQGIEVADRAYAGSWWDWLTPYTILTGLGVVAGYALLGACWLIWKLEGEVQDKAYRLATRAAIATLALMAAVSALQSRAVSRIQRALAGDAQHPVRRRCRW
jgi:cytochrome d ubiquinol oxidase subunit II